MTDRRALIITGRGAKRIESFTRSDFGDITRVERADGSGSVFFADRSVSNSRGMVRTTRVGFLGIPEVRRVEELLRDQARREAA